MGMSVLGIDLDKNSCSLVGLDATGKIVVSRRCGARRSSAMRRTCRPTSWRWRLAAAHHMGRALTRQGRAIRLMSPEYVPPYVKAQEDDDRALSTPD